MIKKKICIFMVLILTITSLMYSNAVFAESADVVGTDQAISEPTDGNTTEGSVDSNNDEQPKPSKNTDQIEQEEESSRGLDVLSTTSEAAVADTSLVTNPYKGYSYKRLIKEIKKLAKKYPSIIETEYIGKTPMGRKIPLVKLGTGEKKILIIGSEHAREYVTTSLIMRSIDTYAQAYARNKKISGTNVKKVLNKVTFYFVPMLNIDGVQLVLGTASSKDKKNVIKYTGKKHYNTYKNLWKANVRGVDLNRNYPFRWSKTYTTKRRGYMSYRGKKKASEPEVRSIVNLCKNNQFSFMFTMHTRGQIIYWKDKYNDVVPGASALSKKVKSITGYTRMPASDWSSCAGESAKWFRSVYNKPAFTIELTPNHLSYKKATKYFNKYVWKKNKALFLKTALVTTPSNKYKVFLSAGKGKVSKRYINIKTGKKYGTLPKAKRKGYIFIGWYTKKSGGTRIKSTTTATQKTNKTIYARYKKK